MAWAKRIFFFLVVNLAMVITISFVLNLLGVGRYLTPYGLDYSSLAVFCFVWGMVGSFMSLLLSRVMAKWMMGVRVIDPNAGRDLGKLVETVHQLARDAGLPAAPEVGIYDSPEVNAFATGPTKSRSLVAVSSGLLQRMNPSEIEGVLAHEIAHVANGDMVTLTLIQGVVNAFVMFLARVAAFAISNAMNSKSDRESRGSGGMVYWLTTMAFEVVFGIIGAMIVAYFSRWREFRADAGGARIAGRDKMKAALVRLRSFTEMVDTSQPRYAAFKISGSRSGFLALLSTHPPLEERIRRLENTL